MAVAPALVKDPAVILADEPTGSLDSETGARVLALIRRLARGEGRTVLLVTHSVPLSSSADRVIELRDRRIVESRRNRDPAPADAARS